MASIPDTFNFTEKSDMTMEELLLLLERMYIDLATAINGKPDLYTRDTDGQPTDSFLDQGSININTTTNKVEMLTNFTSSSTVTWTTLS